MTIKKILIVPGIIVGLVSCTGHDQQTQTNVADTLAAIPGWEKITIDPNLSKDSVYQWLNTQKEVYSYGEEDEYGSAKKSSKVVYSEGPSKNQRDL